MSKPDLVGTSEAAEILGVEPPRISRLREAGRMPPLAADLSATPVWHRADVERVAAADGQPRSFGSADTVKVVGTAEAALILDVHKSQIGRWRRTKAGGFPEPCAELLAGPLWWRKDITAFKRVRATKRRRAAKRKAATA